MVATFGAPVNVTIEDNVIADNGTYNCQLEGGGAAELTSLGGNVNTDGSCSPVGTDQIVIAVSHAVFCGPAVERLEAAPVDKILVTDTIPPADPGPAALQVCSVADLIAQAIKSIHSSQSVSSLFE